MPAAMREVAQPGADLPGDGRGHRDPHDERGYHDRRHGYLWIWRPEEVVEVDGQELLGQDGHPEDGQRVEQEAQEGDRVVEAGVLAQGADQADHHAEHDRDQGGGPDELDRRRDRAAEQRGRRLAGLPVLAEVAVAVEAATRALEPVQVALDHRLVEVELGDPALDLFGLVRGGAGAEVGERVDGDVHQEVHDDGGDQDHDQRHEQSFDEEHEHRGTDLSGRGCRANVVGAAALANGTHHEGASRGWLPASQRQLADGAFHFQNP